MRLEQDRTVLTIAPRLVPPSMTGRPHDVAQALFLRRFPVPCWTMAHVFGRNAMSGYRLEQGLARFSRVGTTVKSPEHFPKDLGADDKHSGLQGERVSIATTAAPDESGGLRGPVSLPGRRGKSVWRVCQRRAGRGCRLGTADRQDRGLASDARRLEGPGHPHHGDPVCSPCVSHNP